MADKQTILEVVQLLLDAPLANRPKPAPGQTDAEMLAAMTRVFGLTLQDIPADLLKAATVQHIAVSRWFPSVSDLRETAVSLMNRAGDVPDAYTAWQQIKRFMRGGPQPHVMAMRAIDALGGVDEFGKSDVDDESSWRARFVAAFETYQRRAVEDSMTLPQVAGYIEQRRELGGQSVAGMIGAAVQRLAVNGGGVE